MTTGTVLLADFLRTPNLDDSRLELTDGVVTYKPGRTFGHGRTIGRVGMVLDRFGEAGVGPRAIIEARNSSLLLDVAYFRSGPPDETDYIRIPPHVAVEVMAYGGDKALARRRVELFVSFGVESAWIVDIDRQEVHIVERGEERMLTPGQRLTTPAVPGLDIDVAELFPEPRTTSVAEPLG